MINIGDTGLHAESFLRIPRSVSSTYRKVAQDVLIEQQDRKSVSCHGIKRQ